MWIFEFWWKLINADSKENDALHKIFECSYTWIDQIKISVKQDCFGNTSICDPGSDSKKTISCHIV